MQYHPTFAAVATFLILTVGVLALWTRLARRAKAGGDEAHWFIHGVAFAGDYLAAGSVLGVCGMIALWGYDGFLYAIGCFVGWIFALLVMAEPLRRLGRFTLGGAVDARFRRRGVKVAAAVSTVIVCVMWLIPQMVGAGAILRPLLGIAPWMGVVLAGGVAIFIVVGAGVRPTTYGQFIKGALVLAAGAMLVGMVLSRGLTQKAVGQGLRMLSADEFVETVLPHFGPESVVPATGGWAGRPYVRLRDGGGKLSVWRASGVRRVQVVWDSAGKGQLVWPMSLMECQVVTWKDGRMLIDGVPRSRENDLKPGGRVLGLNKNGDKTGPLGPVAYLSAIGDATIGTVGKTERIEEADGGVSTVYTINAVTGEDLLVPGASPMFNTLPLPLQKRDWKDRANFVSLMLALFCGASCLPQIMIRFGRGEGAARKKSAMVGIVSIGLFYVFALLLGFGAMTSGGLDMNESNSAMPMLARTLGEVWFGVVSGVTLVVVLGAMMSLMVAAASAVSQDIAGDAMQAQLTDHEKARYGSVAAVVVGIVSVGLGVAFQGMNVAFLAGWAFSVAASANLPALVMMVFWKRATQAGILAGIVVGLVSSVGWILMSGEAYASVYGLPAAKAIVPFGQPGIVTIPLGFLVIVAVSVGGRVMGEGKERI